MPWISDLQILLGSQRPTDCSPKPLRFSSLPSLLWGRECGSKGYSLIFLSILYPPKKSPARMTNPALPFTFSTPSQNFLFPRKYPQQQWYAILHLAKDTYYEHEAVYMSLYPQGDFGLGRNLQYLIQFWIDATNIYYITRQHTVPSLQRL